MNTLERQFDLALKAYDRKIKVYAYQHHREIPGYTDSDLEQELRIVLYKVVQTYNPNKSAQFNTYFWQCARNRQVDLVTKARAIKRTTEWFDFFSDEEGDEQDGNPWTHSHIEEIPMSVFDDRSLSPEDWYLLEERAIELRGQMAA